MRTITAIIIAAAISMTAFWAWKAERFLSSTQFCASCHSMSYPYEELKTSGHYGRLGINPECGDCHLPPDLLGRLRAHVETGIKDLYGEFTRNISTPEKFNRHKERLAASAVEKIKRWDSSPCRACHKDPKPRSVSGQNSHILLKEGKKTCVDCHRQIHYQAVDKVP